MRLILHQAVKDLREQRWLAAAWLATLLAVGAVEALKLDVSVAAGDAVKDHPIPPALLLIALTFARSVLGWLLAARIVQADPVDDTDAFWRTRPISADMLLKSKLALLAFLFLVVPGVEALVVLLANDVAPARIPACIIEWCLFNAVPLAPFVLLATLTRDRARIGLALIVGMFAWTIQLAVSTLFFDDSRRLWGAWTWVYRAQALSLAGAGCLIILLSLVFVIWQYRARPRPFYGWIALGVVLAIAVATAQTQARTNATPAPREWPTDSGWTGASAVSVSIPVASIAATGPSSAATGRFVNRTVRLLGDMVVSGAGDEVVIDVADGRGTLQIPDRGETLAGTDLNWFGYSFLSRLTLRTDAGRRVVERVIGARIVGPSYKSWNALSLARFKEADYEQYEGTRATYQADLVLAAYQVTVSPAVPARPGSSVGIGSMGATVLSAGSRPGEPGCWQAEIRESDARAFLPRTTVRLGYMLRNRRLGEALPLSPRTGYAVMAQGLASTFLTVSEGSFALDCGGSVVPGLVRAGTPPVDKAWLADAELLLVAGERLGTIKRHVVVRDFTMPEVSAKDR